MRLKCAVMNHVHGNNKLFIPRLVWGTAGNSEEEEEEEAARDSSGGRGLVEMNDDTSVRQFVLPRA